MLRIYCKKILTPNFGPTLQEVKISDKQPATQRRFVPGTAGGPTPWEPDQSFKSNLRMLPRIRTPSACFLTIVILSPFPLSVSRASFVGDFEKDGEVAVAQMRAVGKQYYQRGDYDASKEAFQGQLPYNCSASYHMNLHMYSIFFSRVLLSGTAAVEAFPTDAHSHGYLGNSLYRIGYVRLLNFRKEDRS